MASSRWKGLNEPQLSQYRQKRYVLDLQRELDPDTYHEDFNTRHDSNMFHLARQKALRRKFGFPKNADYGTRVIIRPKGWDTEY